MNTATNQIIVSRKGHSWLNFHISSSDFDSRLNEILELTESPTYQKKEYKNSFWVLDLDGSCVAAQSSLNGAMRYINDSRILVHNQKSFV